MTNQLLQPPSDQQVQIAEGWFAAPKTRGTTDILSACVLTFVLSVWTMNHPKIPNFEERTNQGASLGRRIADASVALFGPDYLILRAAGQWLQARMTREILQEFKERFPNPPAQ